MFTIVCSHKYACVHAKTFQLCLTLCDPLDCSLPGSSVHGILQARIVEWVAIPSSRGSSHPGIEPAGGFFTTSATWEAQTNMTSRYFVLLLASPLFLKIIQSVGFPVCHRPQRSLLCFHNCVEHICITSHRYTVWLLFCVVILCGCPAHSGLWVCSRWTGGFAGSLFSACSSSPPSECLLFLQDSVTTIGGRAECLSALKMSLRHLSLSSPWSGS